MGGFPTRTFCFTAWRPGNMVRSPFGCSFIGFQCEQSPRPCRVWGFRVCSGLLCLVTAHPSGNRRGLDTGFREARCADGRNSKALHKQHNFRLSDRGRNRHYFRVATKKTGGVSFRTNAALKEAFEEALGKHPEFNGPTAFFEDAMRSLIQATRQKRQLAIPLELLKREPGDPH